MSAPRESTHGDAVQAALLDLSFVRRGGRTVIDRRRFAWPFVLTRSFHVDPGWTERLTLIVQSGSGAIHAGDRLEQKLALGPGTAVCVTNQGATAVHRAQVSHRAFEHVKLELAEGASLAYVPEPRILFPAAALSQSVELDCASEASALVFDGFTLHDPKGRDDLFHELDSAFCLRRDGGTPIVVERTRLVEPSAGLFRGYRAFGTAMLVTSRSMDVASLHRAVNDALQSMPAVYGAASLLPGHAGLCIRMAAAELRMMRAVFAAVAGIHREAVLEGRMAGVPAAAPAARMQA